MRALKLLSIVPFALLALASTADAQSCATFAVIESYDAENSAITLKIEKGNQQKFFPKTEGAPNTSKIPKKCKRKVLKQGDFPVLATGGRMRITQIRENYSGKMLNDIEDPNWLPTHMTGLVESKDKVVVVLRPPPGQKGKDAIYNVSTIYMPVTQAELDEIARLNAQAEDIE